MDCFEKFGLDDDASLSDLKDAFREKAKEHHPDQGGDKETFIEYYQAYQQAMKVIVGDIDTSDKEFMNTIVNYDIEYSDILFGREQTICYYRREHGYGCVKKRLKFMPPEIVHSGDVYEIKGEGDQGPDRSYNLLLKLNVKNSSPIKKVVENTIEIDSNHVNYEDDHYSFTLDGSDVSLKMPDDQSGALLRNFKDTGYHLHVKNIH
jgi:DnaJ-class molecular chaperone